MLKQLILFVFIASSSFADLATLTVGGSATLHFRADRFSLTCGVVTQGETAEKALKENNVRMERVFLALGSIGLGEENSQTDHFSIQPVYSQRPQDAPSDWTSSIIKFEVTHRLRVTTDDLMLAGRLIDQITQSGVNQIDQIQFELKQPQARREQVIQAATRNALADAQALAEAAGISLGAIHSISIDEARVQPKTLYTFARAEGTTLMPGDLALSATVTIAFLLNN